MSFVMFPPPQITPRMPRERQDRFFDVNMGQNNDAMMMALLQMMLQQQTEKGRLSLEDKIATSQITSQEQQREQVKMQMSAEERRQAADLLTKGTLEPRLGIIKAATDKQRMEISDSMDRETSSGFKSSRLVKTLSAASENYGTKGYQDKDIAEIVSKTGTSFQKEWNAAGSNFVRAGLSRGVQNSLGKIIADPRIDPIVRQQAQLEMDGLDPVIGVAADEAHLNAMRARTLGNFDQSHALELNKRMGTFQERRSERYRNKNLTQADRERLDVEDATKTFADFPLGSREDAPWIVQPGEPESKVRPAPLGTIESLMEGARGAIRSTPEIRTGQNPLRSSSPSVLEGIIGPSGTPVAESLFGTKMTSGLSSFWNWLNAGKHVGADGKTYIQGMEQEKKAQDGLSGYSEQTKPEPLRTETYTPDGWLKTPATPDGDFDFLWNP